MIGGLWLISSGQIVRSAHNEDLPVRRKPYEGTEPLTEVAHRGELSALYSRVRATRTDGTKTFLWVDMVHPTAHEMAMLADVLRLPRLQVDDAMAPRQRPKVERDGDRVFLVVKALTYIDATSDIETHQVSAFVGPGYLVTIAHGRLDIADGIMKRLSHEPILRRFGTASAFYALLDVLVDEYLAVSAEIATDVEEIEESVFSPERTDDSAAIYRLKRENLELRRAVSPLVMTATQVARGIIGDVDEKMKPYFLDVADHLLRVADHAENNDQLLLTLLMASTARQDLRQNADMRRISAWVAIAVVPTLIAGIYGMNFSFMPELDEKWGYPWALGLMIVVCVTLHRMFKRSGWL